MHDFKTESITVMLRRAIESDTFAKVEERDVLFVDSILGSHTSASLLRSNI
jgi:hypothetical protein